MPKSQTARGPITTGNVKRNGLYFGFFSVAFFPEFFRYSDQILGGFLLRLISPLQRLRVASDCFLNKVRIHDTHFDTNIRQFKR